MRANMHDIVIIKAWNYKEKKKKMMKNILENCLERTQR